MYFRQKENAIATAFGELIGFEAKVGLNEEGITSIGSAKGCGGAVECL